MVLARIIRLRPGLALLEAVCCLFACTACSALSPSSCCISYLLAGGPQSNHDSKKYKCRTCSFPHINIHTVIATVCMCVYVLSGVMIYCMVSGQQPDVLKGKQSSVCGTCLITVASIKNMASRYCLALLCKAVSV